MLRSRVPDPGAVAVFSPDGAAAAALEMLFDRNVTADGVVIAVREPRGDHHDRNVFDPFGGRDTSVRRSVAVSPATLDDGDVGNDVNDVGQVGNVGLEVNHRVSHLAVGLLRTFQDVGLNGLAARHRRRVVRGQHVLLPDQEEKEDDDGANSGVRPASKCLELGHVGDFFCSFMKLTCFLVGGLENTECEFFEIHVCLMLTASQRLIRN